MQKLPLATNVKQAVGNLRSVQIVKKTQLEARNSTADFSRLEKLAIQPGTYFFDVPANATIENQTLRTSPSNPFQPQYPAGKNWSLFGWFVFRPSQNFGNGAVNGQLSGSQYGVRLQHKLIRISKIVNLNANLRTSAPLDFADGKEAAIGLALKFSGKIPLDIILERRFPIGTGTPAFAAIAATGMNDVPITHSLLLSGYLQTGLVAATKAEPFIDGSMTIEREIHSRNSISLRVGAGLWGAGQFGASRLDMGPIIAARFPIGKGAVRVSAEWRQRVAGNAQPASGPAVSISTDF